MADSAVTFLLENLTRVALNDIDLISNAKEELDGLKGDLRAMTAFLEASDKLKKDAPFKIYERQIKDVCYEVEDTIDSCISAKKKRNKFALAQEVKDLREKRVKPVFDRVNEFAYLCGKSFDSTKSTQLKARRENKVVGLEEHTNTLIQRLSEETNELDVLSIIGMPGIGKTTLAWKVYRDPRIQNRFPTLIWIFFSQDYNMKDVLLTIMKKFTEEDMSRKTVDDLAELVNGKLKMGKFLIFIDDVWTNEAWDEIETFLPKDNNMGKVLITTRHKKVAIHANVSRDPHELEFLSDEKSFELLHLEVFGALDEIFPGDLKAYGKIIARKCEGLPLAIVVIGGVLVKELSTSGDNTSKWKKVSEDVKKYLIHGEEGKRMENTILLSYQNMPRELKDCFLYLGMFPEDTEIPVWKLSQLWIAEEFIKKRRFSLEETAQEYLNDLISRNLVMIEKRKLNGEVKTCLIHDTIREFCQKRACHDEQDIFQEIRKSKDTGYFEPSDDVIQKCRRLCINSYVHDFFLKNLKVQKTRSFLCNSKETINLQTRDIESIIDAFRVVRILDVNTINFPQFPSKVTDLVHLRYLTLSGDDLKILPKDMSRLSNMQTLTVDTTQKTLKIEANIWDMMQLRHVKTKASMILKKGAKGKGGGNLQTLSRISPQSCTEEVFNKAKNLKTLGIRGELSMLLDSTCLEKLELLQKLKLVNDALHKVASENPLHGFPRIIFPPNIKILTLSSTYVDWVHMSAVGKLGTLEVLKLKDNAFVGSFWDVSPGDVLRKLEFLYIAQTDLEVWTVTSAESFPKLKSIVIKMCKKLDEVPTNLVEKLEMLSMECVTKYAVKSARNVEKTKKEAEGHQMVKRGRFKLIIAPGDE